VDRALGVLRAVVREGRPLTLDELSGRTALHRSVAYRLIRSLEEQGFLGRDPSGGYAVGAGLLAMSVTIASRLDLRTLARPAMDRIAREFGETASLHIRSGAERVCIEVVEGTHEVRRVVPLGETVSIHAGETGRALLSTLGPAERRTHVDAAVAAGSDRAAYEADLDSTRRSGWLIGIGVRTPDVGSISLPVCGSGQLVGALTVSGPANRWNRSAMQAAAPKLMEILGSFDLRFDYHSQGNRRQEGNEETSGL